MKTPKPRTYEWRERNAKWYYYDTETGMIVGTAHKYALQDVWCGTVYTSRYEFVGPKLDDEKPLGQYIEQDYAKKAVENYWGVQSRTMIQ
jgi:hypothetical protein